MKGLPFLMKSGSFDPCKAVREGAEYQPGAGHTISLTTLK